MSEIRDLENQLNTANIDQEHMLIGLCLCEIARQLTRIANHLDAALNHDTYPGLNPQAK